MASTYSDDQFDTSRVVAAAAPSKDDFEDENVFRSVIDEMKKDDLFGGVEIAALRLAATRKDVQLTQALADYRDGDMDSNTFKESLLTVVERIILEVEADI